MTTLGQCIEGPTPAPTPPPLEVVGERKLYLCGGDDFFSYAVKNDGSAAIAKVIAGKIRGVELSLKGGQTIIVSRVGDAVQVQNKDPFMKPAGPVLSTEAEGITIGDIVENVRMMALARLVATRGCLDEVEAIDAGFDPHEIAAYRADMAQAGQQIEAEEPTVTSVLGRALIDNQVLRGRRDELLEANNRYQQEARDARLHEASAQMELALARAEVKELRQIIIDAANALYGTAIVSPNASTEFLRHIPNEVRLRIAALQDRQAPAPIPAVERSSLIVAASEAMSALRPIADSARGVSEDWAPGRARSSVGGSQVTIGHCRAALAAYERLVGILGPEQQFRWLTRTDMDANAAVALYRESEVLISTDRGLWRPGPKGYTRDPLLAGRWNGADAWHMTEGLGAEKQVRFGIPLADPVTV